MSYTWHPTETYLRDSNVARLMSSLEAGTVNELRARSVADVSAFWDHVVSDLGIAFSSPYSSVLDLTNGIAHPEWFVGGGINVVTQCLQRWADSTPSALAVVHEAEDGTVRRLTYDELNDAVSRVASGLRERGIGRGDAVALYLPMIEEAVIATYAVASLGAVLVPLFSGFAPGAIAARLADASVKAVITADGTVRRGRALDLVGNVELAVAQADCVEFMVVVDNTTRDGAQRVSTLKNVSWSSLLNSRRLAEVEDTAASDVLLLAYTSGTTGRPKGAVHTHAGFLVKVASEVAYGFDIVPGRTFCWITDMGWIMGPLSIIGTHACGGTLMLYEGAPDVPDTNRIWGLVQRHGISTLGVSPTLIRALRGDSTVSADQLSSLRVIGSTGEPWDPGSYDWLAVDLLEGRVPVINFSGGTEIGGSLLSPYPAEPISSCSLGGPALGMDVDVVTDAGEPLRGSIGELVCRQPWPSMTRGVWNDPERYLEAYWSTFENLWRHGDFALVDAVGDWYILGRSDDVMNVAGKRVAPAEIESVLAADPSVAESAVVGIPDPTRGEAVWAFWVARPEHQSGDDSEVAQRLRAAVAAGVGKPFAPARVIRVAQLPKTRSAKIMRRAVRAAALDTHPGDLSGAENPEAVAEVRDRVKSLL